jgi:hypothetical protein
MAFHLKSASLFLVALCGLLSARGNVKRREIMPAIFVLVLFTAFAATTPEFLQQSTNYAGNRLADAVGSYPIPREKPYGCDWKHNYYAPGHPICDPALDPVRKHMAD